MNVVPAARHVTGLYRCTRSDTFSPGLVLIHRDFGDIIDVNIIQALNETFLLSRKGGNVLKRDVYLTFMEKRPCQCFEVKLFL